MTVTQLIAVLERYAESSERNGPSSTSDAAKQFGRVLAQRSETRWSDLLKKFKELPKSRSRMS